MTRPTDAVRAAVRKALGELGTGQGSPLALVACSGGPDSLALAAGTAEAVRRIGWRAGAVIVDHRLQPDSGMVAAHAAGQCRGLGLHPVIVTDVEVAPGAGPEAAARAARHAAFAQAATTSGASAVLLAHTLDDQAETVLLGLARGSGARSLQGMAAAAPLPGATGAALVRPLLDLTRADLVQACAQWRLQPWTDPHNSDPRFARVRVRRGAMPALAEALGPGVPQALARTAVLLRDDEALLAQLAADALAGLEQPVRCEALQGFPPALRRRMLHRLALAAGCPPTDLTAGHVFALEAAVTGGRGGVAVALPGGVSATVRYGRLDLARTPPNPQE